MKKKNIAFWCLILSIMVLGLPPIAMAGRGCADVGATPDYISIDKTAPGTKYNATLTINYAEGASCDVFPIPPNKKDMQFFMRVEGNVKKGSQITSGQELYSFEGVGECIPYWNDFHYTEHEAVAAQQLALHEFFQYVAVPYIYGCDPSSSDPDQMCPPFALKSVGKIVDHDDGGGTLFTMMNLVIAIQD